MIFTILAFWVHNLDPFLIHFPNSNFGIRWYGVAYVLGFLIAYYLLRLYYKKNRSPLDPEAQSSFFIALILGVIIGGRLGYMLFYGWNYLIQHPLNIFKIWEGGMSSHGGFAGVIIATYWYSRKHFLSFAGLCDIVATLTPPGILLGRIANFINGYLWGKISYVPWAVIFPQSAPGVPIELISPRHPSQLYASFLEGFILLVYTQIRFWTRPPTAPKGQLAGEFLIAYALVRVIDEFFREPDATLILGISRGQFYSIFLALIGILFIVHAHRKKKNSSI